MSITKTNFIYTIKIKTNIYIHLINYTKFPSSTNYIQINTKKLKYKLIQNIFQNSFSIKTPKTYTFYNKHNINK